MCAPFGQYEAYEMWQAATNLLVMHQATCLQVACLFSPHFPLMLFRHLNYRSGKQLAGRQENLTNSANMHWIFTSLGRDNTTRCVSHCGLALYIKKYLGGHKKNDGNSNIFTMQK
jgi:hypothetical protein